MSVVPARRRFFLDNHWHVHLLEAGQDLVSRYSSAISLHSHTMYSRESLGFIPRYVDRWPLVNRMVAHQKRRYLAIHGHEMDFGRGFWTSAVDPAMAFQLEAGQIAQFGLHPVVSLSDHDSIQACLQLRAQQPDSDIPFSFEWSLFFEGVERS